MTALVQTVAAMGPFTTAHVLAALAIAASLQVLWMLHRAFFGGAAHVPGPWHTRWTSLALDLNYYRGRRALWVHALHHEYGPMVRIAPNEVSFTDLSAIKTIYSTKETFIKAPFYRSISPPDQESIFSTVRPAYHRHSRRLLAGPMSETSLRAHTATVNERVEQAIERIGDEMKTRGAADVLKWWLFLATDTIGELTFGESFRMLELGRINGYALDLQSVGKMGAVRYMFPWIMHLTALIPVPIPLIRRVHHATQRLRNYAFASLARHGNLIAKDPSCVRQTLFSKFFLAANEQRLSPNEMRDEAITYIIAGSDTTANTLTYLVWAVCRQPLIQQRLVAELKTLPAAFEEHDLRALPFLNAVIDETLRLYSAAPSGLPRVVPPEGAVLAGSLFKPGTVVGTQAYSTHRNGNVYPNPDLFDPSRWEAPTKLMKDTFMPFGRGPRNCIGLHLAQIELRLATARFFLAYPNAKVSDREGMSDRDMDPTVFFLFSPSGRRCLIEV
ncbi:hypothetical protein CDD81_6636 [Ophiocordyceps australis]|uniref:Cytochrome P450 n=1 Tax=Ophiocordyceps australis TaxID=1399860 RepID=A0A2C5Y582_9HYPO|nr:hypothetical protein CDD81_6636 [Ophiocordyceps australis]